MYNYDFILFLFQASLVSVEYSKNNMSNEICYNLATGGKQILIAPKIKSNQFQNAALKKRMHPPHTHPHTQTHQQQCGSSFG